MNWLFWWGKKFQFNFPVEYSVITINWHFLQYLIREFVYLIDLKIPWVVPQSHCSVVVGKLLMVVESGQVGHAGQVIGSVDVQGTFVVTGSQLGHTGQVTGSVGVQGEFVVTGSQVGHGSHVITVKSIQISILEKSIEHFDSLSED